MATCFISAAFLVFSLSGLAMTVKNLKCEYYVNPLGVDVMQPEMSWTLQSVKRGDRQTAYQVLVASSEAQLKANQGNLWDSGKVDSDESIQIMYAGHGLISSKQVFWKVRAWDMDGRVSPWSDEATWTMGILHPSEWNAQWISAAGAEKYGRSYPGYERTDFSRRDDFAHQYPDAGKTGEPDYSSLLARREFIVKPGLERAVIHVAGLGQYELSVNGKKVGDALFSPGWTDYHKTVLYDTYDITAMVRKGGNALGLFLGNGMYNIQPDPVRYVKFLNSFGPLKTIAELQLQYANGSVDTIGTDASWRVAPGPVTFNNIFGGEDFDGRLVEAGWDQKDFRLDSQWVPAVETSGPGGILRGITCAAPPIRAMQTLEPATIRKMSTDILVFDLGQNCSMMPRLSVSGPRGSCVRIIPSELLKPDGMVDRRSCTQDGVRPAWWQYTLAGGGTENYFPRFFYQGCRYFQVELFPAKTCGELPKIKKLEGVVIHSSSVPIGTFETSNPLFNHIYWLVRWAQVNNMMSIMTDCPHREKLGWLEQTHLNGPSLRYNFDMAPLLRKVMHDMDDAQLKNGLVPNIAPEYFIAGSPDMNNGFRNSPEWGGAFIMDAWQQYQFDGDTSLMRLYYGDMKRYVAFLGSSARNQIVTTGLGDWYDLGPKPPWGSQLTPVGLTATAFYERLSWILARTAALLGKPDEEKQYDQLATKIRMAFNKAYYHPETHQYASGSQCADSLALVMDLVENTNRSGVVSNLVADVRARGLTAGDVGYRYLLRALADSGHSALIYAMNNQSQKPGYGYQLKMGATSLTEKWDGGVGSFGSQDHFMLGQINEWFYHDLAGIQCDPSGPGFKKIIIKPAVVRGLTSVHASYNSIHGMIESRWQIVGSRFLESVSIPANTTATLYLPASGLQSVTESGSPATQASGVKFLRMDGKWAVFQLGSGNYKFVSNAAD